MISCDADQHNKVMTDFTLGKIKVSITYTTPFEIGCVVCFLPYQFTFSSPDNNSVPTTLSLSRLLSNSIDLSLSCHSYVPKLRRSLVNLIKNCIENNLFLRGQTRGELLSFLNFYSQWFHFTSNVPICNLFSAKSYSIIIPRKNNIKRFFSLSKMLLEVGQQVTFIVFSTGTISQRVPFTWIDL